MAILNVLSRGNNDITGYNDTARAHNDLAATTAPYPGKVTKLLQASRGWKGGWDKE